MIPGPGPISSAVSFPGLVTLLGSAFLRTEAAMTGVAPPEGCGIGHLSDLMSVSVPASAQTSHLLETKPKTFLPLASLELLLGVYAKRNDRNSGLTRVLFSLHKLYPMQVIKEGSGVGGLG